MRNTSNLHALLNELKAAGCPVDLSVAAPPVEKSKLVVEQVGGVHDSMLFETEDGRAAFMADIAVTNRTATPIDLAGVELGTDWSPWWEWLTPQRVPRYGRGKKARKMIGNIDMYKFPGQRGIRFDYDEVLNHLLMENGRVPPACQRRGWLLAIGGPMPAQLRHGQWLDLSLAIIASDDTEYGGEIRVWTDRREPLRKVAKPGIGLFEPGEDGRDLFAMGNAEEGADKGQDSTDLGSGGESNNKP